MGEIKTYRDLHAWQLGMDAIDETYALTARFPKDERFGLVSQMRRASISIPSSVVEGDVVQGDRWSLRYISIAIGSCAELDTQLAAAIRLGFVSAGEAVSLTRVLDRVRPVLYGLRRERRRRLGLKTVGVVLALLSIAAQVWR